MNILFAASEVAPFIKTGGLADVAGSLPKSLAAQGHDVKVILPLYEGIGQQWRNEMTFLKHFNVRLAWRTPYCGLFELRRDGVSYLFVDNEYYFKRAKIYGHYDDAERFAFFSRAVIEAPDQLGWHVDILHCNDWQTSLVPIYLLEGREQYPSLSGTKSVFTIHNIEYQGRYGDQTLEDVFGLNRSYFNEHMLAYHGDVNLMKGAIYAADYITTVSPSYAKELSYPFYAHGLEGVVADNRGKIRGILNGLDTTVYDPSKDPGLISHYSADDLSGKAADKAALQQAVGLKVNPDVPILACVSRLVRHKGFELVAAAVDEIMGMDVQMVVLGTGEWNFEEAFRHAESQYPSRFAARILYSSTLSTAIYGGADMLLMPSVSEPCGLSQMIAMRYGAVPIVRETGGLRDTVTPHLEENGTGFTFADINVHDMIWVIREAVDCYHQEKKAWHALQTRGMKMDFSWDRSADAYLEIYTRLTGLPASVPAETEKPAGAEKPAGPLMEKSEGPLVEKPAGPLMEKPAGPLMEKPAGPLVEKPAAGKKAPARRTAQRTSSKKRTAKTEKKQK